ncbi:hypothetical protein IQ264_20025 [Phormidium sp. LEGE 05292]|uniref:hypothetical protein n=1 Tax=[Phormidium] sp. LEGE 05292 TaxID=767427 RepID=UPI0018814C24|nr:hypothetical protein [Phormidium sp. LEGE 05292]MBE9227717.1 hypothetical protein [Phormidium sp. LEGE 05292]
MNRKLLAILGTTATLVMSTAWVNLAQAKPSSTTSDRQLIQAQATRNGLNLTQKQKTQMRQISAEARTEIQKVLTPAQKEKLRVIRQQRVQGSEFWSSLNLSAQQQAKIRRIRENYRQKMLSVLTPGQKQQLQQTRQERQNRRQVQ